MESARSVSVWCPPSCSDIPVTANGPRRRVCQRAGPYRRRALTPPGYLADTEDCAHRARAGEHGSRAGARLKSNAVGARQDWIRLLVRRAVQKIVERMPTRRCRKAWERIRLKWRAGHLRLREPSTKELAGNLQNALSLVVVV